MGMSAYVDEEQINEGIRQIHGFVGEIVDEVGRLHQLLQRLLDQTQGKYPLIRDSAAMISKEQAALNKVYEALEETKAATNKYVSQVIEAGGDGAFGDAIL